jgi:hypothetical protein
MVIRRSPINADDSVPCHCEPSEEGKRMREDSGRNSFRLSTIKNESRFLLFIALRTVTQYKNSTFSSIKGFRQEFSTKKQPEQTINALMSVPMGLDAPKERDSKTTMQKVGPWEDRQMTSKTFNCFAGAITNGRLDWNLRKTTVRILFAANPN